MSGAVVNASVGRTFGALIGEARTLLQDKLPTSGGVLRYSDDEMMEAINGFMVEARAKRPDLFLARGRRRLRRSLPYYTAANDMGTPFPLSEMVYNACLYYCVGRCELREDTFTDDGRATTLLNKAVSQLLQVQS